MFIELRYVQVIIFFFSKMKHAATNRKWMLKSVSLIGEKLGFYFLGIWTLAQTKETDETLK